MSQIRTVIIVSFIADCYSTIAVVNRALEVNYEYKDF
jgi:hypothetical protein